MKRSALNRTLALLTLAAGAALAAGCGTSANYSQADRTADSMAKYRSTVLHLRTVTDDTIRSLHQIEGAATTNPRPPYEQFSKNVSTLEKAIAKSRKAGQTVRETGEAYFSRWDSQSSQVKNQEVRELTEQRKAKLKSTFDSLKKASEPVNARFDPWLSDLKDLQTYLGNDLTVTGVADAKKLFFKAKDDGADVAKALDELVAELNRSAAEMAPAKMPDAKPQAPKK